jgi:hypothetical protein
MPSAMGPIAAACCGLQELAEFPLLLPVSLATWKDVGRVAICKRGSELGRFR